MALAVSAHLCTGTMDNVSGTIRSRLRNLMGYVHENCLIMLDLICQRWVTVCSSQTGESYPAINLDILVRIKRYGGLRRGEHIMLLRQHSEMITTCLRQLCRPAASRKPQLSSRGSPADLRGGRTPSAPPATSTSLQAVADLLSARTPVDRLKVSVIRSRMVNFMRFVQLLDPPDSPWPTMDEKRFWQDPEPTEGPVIYFEPLPPMLPVLGDKDSLPPIRVPRGYTLVLDLDETLVHFFEVEGVGQYGTRPGCSAFLDRMVKLGYELVIFTASTQDYADWMIDQIDSEGRVHHRLYRQHALPWGPIYVKDLSRLGRDMDRMLIIDNVQENFMLQPLNGIFISSWYEDPNDTALFALVPLLEEIITTQTKVPEVLDKYRDQIPTWAGFDHYPEADAWPEDIFDTPDQVGRAVAPAGVGEIPGYQGYAPPRAGNSLAGPYQAAPPPAPVPKARQTALPAAQSNSFRPQPRAPVAGAYQAVPKSVPSRHANQ